MQKASKFGRFLVLLFLAGALWLVYGILVFAFKETPNDNMAYIPENATSVYRLDGRLLTREMLASLLISGDADLQKMAQNRIPTTKGGKIKPVGISFDSDIILFRLKEGNNQFTGLLFNIWDQRTFDRNLPKYLGENGATSSTETVGLVLLQIDGTISNKQLNEKAKTLLAQETKFRKKYPEPESESLISVWYKEDNLAISDVGLTVQDNQLLIQGTFETGENLNTQQLPMYEGGFHVHSQWFPKTWNAVIQTYFKEQGLDVPPIRQFSFNYFSGFIATEPSIALLPVLSGAIEFETPIVADSLFKTFDIVSRDVATNETTYEILTRQYIVSQLNSNTIVIRSTEKMDLTEKKFSSIAEFSGSPDFLLKLEGDAFIRRIMTLSSEYRATGSLINEIEEIDLKMTSAAAGKYRIHGKVLLKNDKWPLNELLKFLIRSKLL